MAKTYRVERVLAGSLNVVIDRLADLVNEALASGWSLYGDVCVRYQPDKQVFYAYQALVLSAGR